MTWFDVLIVWNFILTFAFYYGIKYVVVQRKNRNLAKAQYDGFLEKLKGLDLNSEEAHMLLRWKREAEYESMWK